MNNFFEKRINLILIIAVIVLCILVGIPTALTHCQVTTGTYDEVTTTPTFTTAKLPEETTEPSETEVKVKAETVNAKTKTADASAKSTKSKTKSAENTTKNREKAKKATEATEAIQFATAAKGGTKVAYSTQWNAGYLVAVDYPDTNYKCPHVELTDENRDLLERLCMGEFGSGGFTGAALIAQSVKNAMVHYGYDDVATVIKNLHYKGKLKNNPTKAVKDAVIYVFDMDKDAIQHRILFMYNPKIKNSAFHESQRYICTYKNVRFFDK